MMTKTRVEHQDYGAESGYKSLTDKAIKELALAVRAGSVFGTWNFRESEKNMIGTVFMAFMLMNSIQKKILVRDGIFHLYEFMDKAGPRSINGYPIFYSFHMLDRDDAKRLETALDALESFMGEP
jgi:hypothetical protein